MSPRGVFTARTVVNARLCREHYRLVVALDTFPATRPGQFVQVQCRDLTEPVAAGELEWSADRPPRPTQSELTGSSPLLRRPFSLAGRRDVPGGVELDIIYRVVGRGTDWLTSLAPGDPVSLLGPLGNAFSILPDRPRAVLVGGGVGIPPMLYLAEALAAAGREITVFVGAQSADLLPLTRTAGAAPAVDGEPVPCLREFAAFNTRDVVATDDGSLGCRGFVTEPLNRWLDRLEFLPGEMVVYTCGPEAMMRRVAESCLRREIDCQVSMERSMGCGMGTCQSCICKARADTDRGWAWKLCCTDGPVFNAAQLLWE